jgi:hypothetical protein
VGQEASVTIDVTVKGASPTYKWSASKGHFLGAEAPATIYVAPQSAGHDTVTMVVTAGGVTMVRTVTFTITELSAAMVPTPTEAVMLSAPAAAPVTSTPLPEPLPAIACNHLSVTKNVFSRLVPEQGQFPFYGLLDDPNFQCHAVYDRFHTAPMAVKLDYRNAGKNYGFWGIATPNGYDASRFSKLCFWAYAERPNQAFRLKMRDLSDVEKGVALNVELAQEWSQLCTELVKISEQGVRLDRLKNVNLGFEQTSGTAIVWVDDFELK